MHAAFILRSFCFMPVFWMLWEKDGMKGYKVRPLVEFDPLTPTLLPTAPCVALPPTSLPASRRERGFVGQP